MNSLVGSSLSFFVVLGSVTYVVEAQACPLDVNRIAMAMGFQMMSDQCPYEAGPG